MQKGRGAIDAMKSRALHPVELDAPAVESAAAVTTLGREELVRRRSSLVRAIEAIDAELEVRNAS